MGHISGLFGVKGWLKIFSYTRPRLQIVDYKLWYLVSDAENMAFKQVALLDGRAHKEGVIAKLADIDDRDTAAALLGMEIWVDENELSSLNEGEYYWYQLVGLQVINTDNFAFGTVTELLETGANDVLVVHDDKSNEYLIPYIKGRVIKSVDLDKKNIVVDWEKDY
ncbi:MAG: ribosome maturation factor RimM [Pseudomonadota bacterium]